MNEVIQHTLDGTIANFWVDFDSNKLESEPLPGYVHLSNQNRLVLDALVPQQRSPGDPDIHARMKLPQAIPAATTKSGALFFDFESVGGHEIWGGIAASSLSYTARSVAVGVNIYDLQTAGVKQVEAHFPGLAKWTGMRGIERTPTIGDDNIPTSVTATVKAAEKSSEELGDGRMLTLSTTWNVSGDDTNLAFYSAASFGSESVTPLEWHEHLTPLLAIQDLLGLAYQGFVAADGGCIDLDISSSKRPGAARLWCERLMVAPEGSADPQLKDAFPTFNLGTIGELAGVRRWIALAAAHPRAVGPIVFRTGRGAVETRILELASAIEYWIAVNRAQRQIWAKKTKNEPLTSPLVRFIGEPFVKWVGDPIKWSDKFWAAYSLLKHDSRRTYDVHEFSVLAQSAAVLMECALLNAAAENNDPAVAICRSHRNERLGRSVRDLWGS